MVFVCIGLLGKEGCVNISVDTRLQTEYLYLQSSRFTVEKEISDFI